MSYDRSSNLKRGTACLACRRRKTRCDGGQPVCNNCIEGNRVDDCEYSDGLTLTATQTYEESIRQLEARKRDLEAASASTTASLPFQLYQPYDPQISQPDVGTAQEPNPDIANRLVDTFLPYSSELGFFLHPQRFKAGLALSEPAGHPSRPAPALLFAVYLWGIRLSGNADCLAHEPSFHARAMEEAAANLSGDHPQRIVHGIQADVLLAYYYISQEKFVEAGHYVTSAMTTALSASLHTIRSRHTQSEMEESTLPSTQDPVEEGERILAMWNVFVLDKMSAIVTGQMPNFATVNDRPDRRVDVPWPMDMVDYGQGRLPLQLRTERTVDKFLNNEPTSDGRHNAAMTMLAKAVFLWEKASELAQQCTPGLPQAQYASLAFERRKTEHLVEGLEAYVPPIAQFMSIGTVEDVRKRILWASVLRAAMIKLHEPVLRMNPGDDASRSKVLIAALGIFDIAIATTGRGVGFLNPFVAYAWVDAARVVSSQIVYLRGMRQIWETPNDAESTLLRRLGQAVRAMESFANILPIFRSKVAEVQRICEGLGL